MIPDTKLAVLLLDHGADPNVALDNGSTALHLAIYYKRWDLTCLLIGYGAEVDATDSSGMSPLMVAASTHGDVDIIQLLLFYGADPNLRESLGKTPLYMAVCYDHLEAARLLLG